jgi:putative addiction module CopG family antidote
MESKPFEKFSVTLPGEMARVIHERVNSGDYGSVSEVIRDAMRAWLKRERRLAVLDAALARGIAEHDSGQGLDAEQVRKELLEKLSVEGSVPRPPAKPSRKPPVKEEIVAELAALEAPLRKRGLTSLALFGSFARNTTVRSSDIDLLVDLAPDVRFSLIDLVSLKDFLEDRLRRSVDVVTKEGLEPALRDRVLREAEIVF